jgi:hypothetical protein
MKKIIMITLALVLGVTMCFGKPKVKKHRDRIRLGGYLKVQSQTVTLVDANGMEIVSKHIFCEGDGDMRCRDQNLGILDTELDWETPSEYTVSEKAVAQGIIDLGDNDIDNGSTSGTRTSTVQFLDVVTSTYYYRTFTYTWTSNVLNEVESVLDISNKF